MSILIFVLACYGTTLLIVESKIMKPVREAAKKISTIFYGLMTCMMCTGFWVGFWGANLLYFSPTILAIGKHQPLFFYNLFDGAFVSGCIWLLHLIQLNLERHVEDKL